MTKKQVESVELVKGLVYSPENLNVNPTTVRNVMPKKAPVAPPPPPAKKAQD